MTPSNLKPGSERRPLQKVMITYLAGRTVWREQVRVVRCISWLSTSGTHTEQTLICFLCRWPKERTRYSRFLNPIYSRSTNVTHKMKYYFWIKIRELMWNRAMQVDIGMLTSPDAGWYWHADVNRMQVDIGMLASQDAGWYWHAHVTGDWWKLIFFLVLLQLLLFEIACLSLQSLQLLIFAIFAIACLWKCFSLQYLLQLLIILLNPIAFLNYIYYHAG